HHVFQEHHVDLLLLLCKLHHLHLGRGEEKLVDIADFESLVDLFESFVGVDEGREDRTRGGQVKQGHDIALFNHAVGGVVRSHHVEVHGAYKLLRHKCDPLFNLRHLPVICTSMGSFTYCCTIEAHMLRRGWRTSTSRFRMNILKRKLLSCITELMPVAVRLPVGDPTALL